MLKHGMAFPEIWKDKRVSLYNLFYSNYLDLLEKYIGLKKVIRNSNAQKVYKELLEKHQ